MAEAIGRALGDTSLFVAVEQEQVPIDDAVADAWASLRMALGEQGRRMPVNDSWIAATATALRVLVVTQDTDYDDVPGVQVIAL